MNFFQLFRVPFGSLIQIWPDYEATYLDQCRRAHRDLGGQTPVGEIQCIPYARSVGDFDLFFFPMRLGLYLGLFVRGRREPPPL